MTKAHISSSRSTLANQNGGLFFFSGIMAMASGAAAFLLGIWAAFIFCLFLLLPTRLVPIGRTQWAGMTIMKKIGDYQTCEVMNGVKSCRIVKAVDPLVFSTAENNIWWNLNVLIHVIPLVIMTFGLWQVFRCFQRVAKGLLFELETIKCLRNFTLAGLVFTLWAPNSLWLCEQLSKAFGPLVSALRSMSLHYRGKVVETFVAVNLQTPPISSAFLTSIILIIFALTLAILTAVIAKAAAIVEDHAQIV